MTGGVGSTEPQKSGGAGFAGAGAGYGVGSTEPRKSGGAGFAGAGAGYGVGSTEPQKSGGAGFAGAGAGYAPILATRNLGLDIGGATIVADVSLEVRDGEFLGIIGPNGAGKTSLFNLLSGLYTPTAGSIELDGRDVTSDPPYRRSHAGLGRTFQTSSVFPLLPALENVRLAAEARLGGSLRIWRPAARFREAIERASGALERVGLARRAEWTAGALSHGDKRKLELAMVLAGDARVILLDEPMAGVSVEDVPELVDVIKSVQVEDGKTVLMVEHHIGVVTGAAERIAVMHHGRLLACDTTEKVMANEEVQAAYVGEAL